MDNMTLGFIVLALAMLLPEAIAFINRVIDYADSINKDKDFINQ